MLLPSHRSDGAASSAKGATVRQHQMPSSDLRVVLEPDSARGPGAWVGSKAVVTLGPSAHSVDTLVSLLRAGMSCARIDLTWGALAFHLRSLHNLNEVRIAAGAASCFRARPGAAVTADWRSSTRRTCRRCGAATSCAPSWWTRWGARSVSRRLQGTPRAVMRRPSAPPTPATHRAPRACPPAAHAVVRRSYTEDALGWPVHDQQLMVHEGERVVLSSDALHVDDATLVRATHAHALPATQQPGPHHRVAMPGHCALRTAPLVRHGA